MLVRGWEMRSAFLESKVKCGGQECPSHMGMVVTLQDAARL
jgi:hypothetical protein